MSQISAYTILKCSQSPQLDSEIPHSDANLSGFVNIIGARAKKWAFEGFEGFFTLHVQDLGMLSIYTWQMTSER